MFDPVPRVYYTEHKGKKILIQDMSNCSPDEGIQMLNQTLKFSAQGPKKSILIATDVSGGRYNAKFLEAAKIASAKDQPYIKKWAIVGIDGIKEIALQAVATYAKRDYAIFDTMEEAKDWLAED